ncbi:MAG: hypothetical protein UZ14_CFX002003071 [Chloroflexi bacterium OLB14]|nr:MAG: hypothetical protein UZ14_CFX002003071 [Chloroflexi bacterium OLB14]
MKRTDIIIFDGRVDMSDSECHIETISLNQTKNNLKSVGLDTSLKKHSGLLDQRDIL